MSDRPWRLRVAGELGAPRTLAGGADQFVELSPGTGGRTLVLGLGPEPEQLDRMLGLAGSIIYYMEAPEFLAQVPDAVKGLTRSWMHRDLDWLVELPGEELRSLRIVRYLPGARVFPSYWGPVLGRVRAMLAGTGPGPLPGRRVLLPGEENGLLLHELARAFQEMGWEVAQVAVARGAHPEPEVLARRLAREPANLYFSVNFQGLDPYGEVFHTIEQAGCRVAAWCVDNPWHLVSGLKSGFWKQMPLFATDKALVADLAAHGAGQARFLPLAASPALFRAAGTGRGGSDLGQRVVFVGRSAFPGKAGFFAGLGVDGERMDRARELLRRGGRPDFLWWAGELGIGERWPSKEVRRAGLGAEECGLLHRTLCLQAAARDLPLTVYGDAGWSGLLDAGTDLRPPLDYYDDLPGVYAGARACLNMTSPLLPAGLTQRHFDVWIAGGLLVSDATPGLELFPTDLAGPVAFARPEEIAPTLASLEALPQGGRDLRRAWVEHILGAHTYAHRVAEVLTAMGLDSRDARAPGK